MRKIISLFLILLIFTGIINAAGEKPEEFLGLLIPAKYAAKGNTFAGYTEGVDSCWLNPAGAEKGDRIQFSIGALKWIADVSLLYGSVFFPMQKGNINIGAGYLGSSPEVFVSKSGNEINSQELNFKNMFLSAVYGRKFFNLPFGVGLKFISSEIGTDKKLMVFGDIGVITEFNFLKLYKPHEKNLQAGIVLKNIGIVNYKNEGFCEIRSGIKYKIFSSRRAVALNLVSDIWSYSGKTIEYGFGSELIFSRLISISAGYNPFSVNKLCFGSGVNLKLKKFDLNLDYSLNPSLTSGLATSHWVQLTFSSKPVDVKLEEKDHLDKAKKYMHSDDYEKAKEEMDELLDVSPDNKEARKMSIIIQNKIKQKEIKTHFDKSDNYMKSKDYENAEEELLEVIKIAPENKDTYYKLGKIYFNKGDYKKSLEYVKKSLKIDKNYKKAEIFKQKLLLEIKKDKPEWLEEGYFYAKSKLLFEKFNRKTIVHKFMALTGKFERIVETKARYGRWEIDAGNDDNTLKTSIRLPDLSKFDGIIFSVRSKDLPRFDLVLVEHKMGKVQEWIVPISGVISEWKTVKVPFRYFQLPDETESKIDLKKIKSINFLISDEMSEYKGKGLKPGCIDIDNIYFYKEGG